MNKFVLLLRVALFKTSPDLRWFLIPGSKQPIVEIAGPLMVAGAHAVAKGFTQLGVFLRGAWGGKTSKTTLQHIWYLEIGWFQTG